MCPRVGKRAVVLVSYEKYLLYEKHLFAEHSSEEQLHLDSDFLFPGKKSFITAQEILIFACESGK